MDSDDHELIRRLCTKAGTIMEGMSVNAIAASGFLPGRIKQTLAELEIAAAQITALVNAARAVNEA
jgi:hypothetical protein